MVEDLDRSRSDNVGKAPWLKIFMGFKLALDPKKLLLAAVGIFVAYLGWWAISWVFYNLRSDSHGGRRISDLKTPEAKGSFLKQRRFLDLAASAWPARLSIREIVDELGQVAEKEPRQRRRSSNLLKAMEPRLRRAAANVPGTKIAGPISSWSCPRSFRNGAITSSVRATLCSYLHFSVEPLYKFLLPVTYFFDSRAGGMLSWNRLYLIADHVLDDRDLGHFRRGHHAHGLRAAGPQRKSRPA